MDNTADTLVTCNGRNKEARRNPRVTYSDINNRRDRAEGGLT